MKLREELSKYKLMYENEKGEMASKFGEGVSKINNLETQICGLMSKTEKLENDNNKLKEEKEFISNFCKEHLAHGSSAEQIDLIKYSDTLKANQN